MRTCSSNISIENKDISLSNRSLVCIEFSFVYKQEAKANTANEVGEGMKVVLKASAPTPPTCKQQGNLFPLRENIAVN